MKKWMIGASMAVAMLGMGSAASAADEVYCVASAFSNDMPTVVAIFKTKNQHDGYFTECSDCSTKWHHYLEAKYDNYFKFTIDTHGPYDSRSKAKEKAQDFESDARHRWHQPFYEASDFSCSGD